MERPEIESLLADYRPRLRRWAGGRLPHYAREEADTEDLVQDALIGLMKNAPTFEPRGDWALDAYLRRAIQNRIRDELRRVASRPRREPLVDTHVSEDDSPLDLVARREMRETCGALLATLDPVQREAVIARVELGCSYREVAALIGKPSADAARMVVLRALLELAARARTRPASSARG